MDHTFTLIWHKLFRSLGILALLFSLFALSRLPSAHASSGPQQADFTLDGVQLSLAASSLPSGSFMTAEPDAASQVATSASWHPFREFEITAIPFGSQAGTESLPAATSGGADLYRAALSAFRLQQGADVSDGPLATLFGQKVIGLHSSVLLNIDGPQPVPVTIDEWVVEAGPRLWIVRSSQEQSEGDLSAQAMGLDGLILSSNTLDQPTTLTGEPTPGETSGSLEALAGSSLPTPTWWQGDCDLNTYTAGSAGRASYRLGEVYLALPACGPRPYSDGAPDVLVRFFTGSWGEYEWECVELAMRFMYLMYGIAPYQANGSQVVWNYAGTRLVKVSNGTPGMAPQPNDILSYGATSTYGHAAVVTSSSVDANGNGTLTVIEQNSSANGKNTLTVSNWTVSAYSGSISGWLHDPASDPTPTPTFTSTPGDSPTPTDTGLPTGTPAPSDTPTPTPIPAPLTISGNAGAAGVVLSYFDSLARTVIADASGNYSLTVPYNWSGTVTPSKTGLVFTPASRSYTALATPQVGQDYDLLKTSTFYSAGALDGWVTESSENSGLGGSINSSATTLRVGDNSADRQLRSILSFYTDPLPDNAVLVSATLRFRHYSLTGTSPFTTHGSLQGDILYGIFSGNKYLQTADFQAASSRDAVLSFSSSTLNGWYAQALSAPDLAYIKKTGNTQFRLRFALDDNDDLSSDYLSVYSGNATTSYRPQLVIQYYIP